MPMPRDPGIDRLLSIVRDLHQDVELRERFAYEPLQVLSSYGIGAAERDLLRRASSGDGKELLGEEVHAILKELHILVPVPWASPRGWRITRVDPPSLPVTARAAQVAVHLRPLYGTGSYDGSFSHGRVTKVTFNNGPTRVEVADVKVQVEDIVKITGNVVFHAPGYYGLKVRYGPNLRWKIPWRGQFTAYTAAAEDRRDGDDV